MKRLKCRFWQGLVFPLLFIFLSLWPGGCARNTNSSNILHLHLDTDPTTLDPALITDVGSGRLSALLYDTLIRYDENLHVVPCLAHSWKISKDGRTYTFYLKKGVRFSNGECLTAQDVLFSLMRLVDPKAMSPRSWILSHVEGFYEFRSGQADRLRGLKKKGKYKIVISLEKPFAPFLSLLTMPNASVMAQDAFQKGELVGTGPFFLKSWKHDYEIFLSRNEKYHDQPSRMDGVSFRIIKETLFVSSEFRRGRLDVIEIPGPEISLYQNDPQWKNQILSQDNLNLYYMGFNCRKVPFLNQENRIAMSALIHPEGIIQTLRKGRATPLHGPIPPLLLGDPIDTSNLSVSSVSLWKSSEKKMSQRYDHPLILLQSSNEETLEISESIQAKLKETGIEVKIVEEEWSAFKARLLKGDCDLFILSWWADYPDGENFLYPLFHSSNIGSGGNNTGFQDAEIDAMIEKSQETVSENERIKLYREIEKKVARMSPMVFLYSSRSILVKQPWVKNFTSHPLYNGNKLANVEIQKK